LRTGQTSRAEHKEDLLAITTRRDHLKETARLKRGKQGKRNARERRLTAGREDEG